MSLLARLEAEAEHLLSVLKHMADHQLKNFGGVQPQTQALLDDVKAHVDATAPAPEPAPVVAPVVDTPAPVAAPVDVASASTVDVVPETPAAATDTTAPAA
jgi:hypothetical protein